tara:strand:- start:3403 stop:3657 length:255 start_codon:yes stop_codon:yes gene_type:complete
MEETREEQRKIAVVKLELTIDKALNNLKRQMLADPIRARAKVEEIRTKYMLNDDTIGMFASVGMITEYTTLLKKFNNLLDGVLS